MITGLTSSAHRYAGVHPAFADAFDFLNTAEPAELPVGSHHRGLFTAVVLDVRGKGTADSRLEYHRRDIDIHATLEGHDIIGWRPKSLCLRDTAEFDEVNDIGFVRDRPDVWIPVPVGSFAVFFPQDAHAPLAGHEPIRKVVLKIAA